MRADIWPGQTVAVMASGPSLKEADIELVRAAGLPTIAVNTTWEKVRWCDAIYAGDFRWWKVHGQGIDIPALRFSASKKSEDKYQAKRHKSKMGQGGYNSGMMAIEVAVLRGAQRVLLLGFDCSLKNGSHHHGDHTKTPNPNRSRIRQWHRQFEKFRKAYPKAEVINCSRYTELEAFPIRNLDEVLSELTLHRP